MKKLIIITLILLTSNFIRTEDYLNRLPENSLIRQANLEGRGTGWLGCDSWRRSNCDYLNEIFEDIARGVKVTAYARYISFFTAIFFGFRDDQEAITFHQRSCLIDEYARNILSGKDRATITQELRYLYEMRKTIGQDSDRLSI